MLSHRNECNECLSVITNRFILFQSNARRTRDDSYQVTQKQRPASDNAHNISIRAYLSRFLKQSKHSFGLNPIVTSAITAEKPGQTLPTKPLQSVSTQSADKRSTFPIAMNYSALHRPKLNCRNISSLARSGNRALNEQELSALARGIEAENTVQEKPCRYDKHITVRKGSDNGILPARLGTSGVFNPLQGPYTPSQLSSNINRFTNLEHQVGLSIISTPAPVQYKDESVANPSADSLYTNPMESNAAYRLVYCCHFVVL